MTAAQRLASTAASPAAPCLKLHGFRLDYAAAMRAVASGACAAQVAIAAGSKATSRRNLRRVGLKIIDRLVHSGQIRDTFDQLRYTIEQFCHAIINALQATKKTYCSHKGKVCVREVPDWKTQTKAADLYMRAVGMDQWPVLVERVAQLVESRPYDDWVLLAALSSKELTCLIELAVETVASRRLQRPARRSHGSVGDPFEVSARSAHRSFRQRFRDGPSRLSSGSRLDPLEWSNG